MSRPCFVKSMWFLKTVRPYDSFGGQMELGAQAEELMMMIVHLFGGVSSPSCANFAFKKAVEDNPLSFRPSPRVSSLKRTAIPDKDGDTCKT